MLNELEQLGERCFYCYTDSILFLQTNDPNEYTPKLSSAVGGLSNELESFRKSSTFDPRIVEFCCIAPKSYAFKIQVDEDKYEYVIKCKGLRISDETSHLVNFEAMKSFVLGEKISNENDDNFIIHKLPVSYKRMKVIPHYKIITTTETKLFGFTFDKRICEGNEHTVYPSIRV